MTCGMLGELLQLIKIENGDAIIAPVTYRGSLGKKTSTVTCQSIVDDYMPQNYSITNADEHKYAMKNPDYKITDWSSKLVMGLSFLARESGQMNVLARATPNNHLCRSNNTFVRVNFGNITFAYHRARFCS